MWAGACGRRVRDCSYRLDKGHDVHQLSDQEKDDVPDDVKEAARQLGREAFEKRLNEIKMSTYDHEIYSSISDVVQQETKALKVILSALEAKEDERVWLYHQTDGELDDGKLVEGLVGEQTVYKRRGVSESNPGGPQKHPKRITFVVDVSGSMCVPIFRSF
jgi:hypothetical protein